MNGESKYVLFQIRVTMAFNRSVTYHIAGKLTVLVVVTSGNGWSPNGGDLFTVIHRKVAFK